MVVVNDLHDGRFEIEGYGIVWRKNLINDIEKAELEGVL